MNTYQLIAGFSDIKVELLDKTRTQKSMSQLRLWFTFKNGCLVVHDYENHKCCLVLAHKGQNDINVFLKAGSFGKRLVEHIFSKFDDSHIMIETNNLYDSYGFI